MPEEDDFKDVLKSLGVGKTTGEVARAYYNTLPADTSLWIKYVAMYVCAWFATIKSTGIVKPKDIYKFWKRSPADRNMYWEVAAIVYHALQTTDARLHNDLPAIFIPACEGCAEIGSTFCLRKTGKAWRNSDNISCVLCHLKRRGCSHTGGGSPRKIIPRKRAGDTSSDVSPYEDEEDSKDTNSDKSPVRPRTRAAVARLAKKSKHESNQGRSGKTHMKQVSVEHNGRDHKKSRNDIAVIDYIVIDDTSDEEGPGTPSGDTISAPLNKGKSSPRISKRVEKQGGGQEQALVENPSGPGTPSSSASRAAHRAFGSQEPKAEISILGEQDRPNELQKAASRSIEEIARVICSYAKQNSCQPEDAELYLKILDLGVRLAELDERVDSRDRMESDVKRLVKEAEQEIIAYITENGCQDVFLKVKILELRARMELVQQ